MKKHLTLLLTMCLMLMAMPMQAAMYIVGDAPFGGWKTNAGMAMTQSGSTYTATADISGTVYFCFATQLCEGEGDWTTFNNYRLGAESYNQSVIAGTTYTAHAGYGNSFMFTGNGTFTFTYNSTNNTFMVTTDNGTSVDPNTGDVFILGEANGNEWGPNVGVQLSTTDSNVFTGEITFSAGNTVDGEVGEYSYFSFTTKLAESSDDWSGISPYRFGPVSNGDFLVTTSQLGNKIGLVAPGAGENAFRIPDGTYTITVDLDALTCVITKVENETTYEPGWPSNYGGVMLQGFYWDSYTPSSWVNLTDRAQELGQFFDVIWVPQSGKIADNMPQQMGYNPVYWLNQNSCFGTEAQLRTMINTYRKYNTSMMAEVVLNHKNGVSSYTDLADEEVYGSTTGRTFSLSWSVADICQDDECVAAGYPATGAKDERDGFDGGRDLDHTGSNVQANVKTYEDFLLNELGYDGFRYDMSKGYAGYYTGLYNAASKPTFSVGEYWDGSADNLRTWLNDTKRDNQIQSAVFDFALKYQINSAFGSGTWSALADKGISADASYQRYAVSFIDNHDTGSNNYTNSLQSNIPAANAFILAMPGTPCIFLKHYQVYASEIQNCIRARRAAGVHNQSSILTQGESNGGYILETQGTNGNLYLQLGGATSNGTPSGYQLVQSGDNYKLYITSGIDWEHVAKDGTILGYPVVSKAGGNYQGSVSLTVAPSASGTTVVYTTDGSMPTATSSTLTAQQNFTFSESTVLHVGVLNGSQVENVETYIYTITEQATSGINVYVQSSLSAANIYAWSTGQLTGGWPGKQVSTLPTKTVGGIQWHYLHVDADQLKVILNDGAGGFQKQTATIPVSRDVYLVYPNTDLAVSGYGYTAADTYKDVTEQYAGGSYVPVYVMGNVNATGWAPNNGVELTTEDGETYTAIIDFNEGWEGYSYFAFTTLLGANNEDWDAISSSRFGATESDYTISADLLGTEITCATSGTNSFKIPVGMYRLTLQLSTHKLTVEAYMPSVYVIGNVNGTGWAANNGIQMTRAEGSNTYTATIDFAGAYGDDDYSYFSFTTQLAADADDWDGIAGNRFGAVSEGDFLLYPDLLATELSCVKVGYGSNAFKIPTGKYNLALNWETRKLVVTAYGVTRGDVNGNGTVTLADVTALVNHLTNGTTINTANADCNGDGQVTTADINRLVNYILTGSWK